ncbi:MAG: glycosyltransferase family 2 protein [Candidatus Omnitrophica bacterium]|nr:glycosyltransferase family 2 protein [Candidatus Omnitrophota bacterium]
MIHGKKIVVTMPAYNAEKTLERTYREVPRDVVDLVILVDDASQDRTVEVAQRLGIDVVIRHEKNLGYGGNQKTCYQEALKQGADIVIMLHPDYQYTPALIEPMAWLIAHGTYDVALGSRMLGNYTLQGGMPLHKFIINRLLTFFENVLLFQHVSEYHTGYRAYSRRVLESVPFTVNSDGFVFDNQMLAQIFYAGFRVGEISCPTKYFPEASSISFRNGIRYSFGVMKVALQYRLHALGLKKSVLFEGIQKNKQPQLSNAF